MRKNYQPVIGFRPNEKDRELLDFIRANAEVETDTEAIRKALRYTVTYIKNQQTELQVLQERAKFAPVVIKRSDHPQGSAFLRVGRFYFLVSHGF